MRTYKEPKLVPDADGLIADTPNSLASPCFPCGAHLFEAMTVFSSWLAAGKDMVGALGAEVDRLENEVRELVPGLRHIDLETDRGGRTHPSHGSTDLHQYQTAVPVSPVGQPS